MTQFTYQRPIGLSSCLLSGLLVWSVVSLGCAAGGKDLALRLDAADAELRDRSTALERSLDAAYDREKALAERVRRLEESVAVLQAQVASGNVAGHQEGEQIARLDRPSSRAAVAPSGTLDVPAAYAAAYELHQARQYDAARAAFEQIIEAAPAHALADNAWYWIGETHYGLGRYRQALVAFERVQAFEATEKDDDARLMIARSHLALGDKDRAINAFRQLLKDHEDSEYADTARKELRYLEGP